MPDFHTAIGQDMLEESADTLDGVEMGRTEAGTAHCTGGESHRAVREAHDAAVGDGDPEDRRGEGGEGRVAVVIGLTLDVPGDGPDLWGDVLQQSGVAHVCFEEGLVDRRARCHGDIQVASGGPPGRAVLGEASPRDDGVDVGVILELPAPGRQDTGATREGGPDEALVLRQPLEGCCRRLQQGMVREVLMRADKRA